ncbi:MAG: hypothetical protein AB8B99_17215 [Phormidesmis sp.]
MSSAASPNSAGQSVGSSSAKAGLRTPPARPQLMGPPSRPKPPVAAAPAAPAPVPTPEPEAPKVIGPISAPSERMQYRAIGMLKGKYVASEEQFNRGDIAVEDGTLVDAVLLGRVTSLIKKHIDLDKDHVWVVYPRTLYSEDNVPALHVQIVGVWEPETLNDRSSDKSDAADKSAADEAAAAEAGPRYLTTEEAAEQCDHFSIRGEIAKYDEDKQEITVNIVQKSKSETTKPKRPFKLLISGTLTGRTVGYFWDLEVNREAGKLILEEAKPIAVVPPKKKSKHVRKDGVRRRAPGKPRSGGAPKPVPKPKTAEKSDDKPTDGEDHLAESVPQNGTAATSEATSAEVLTANNELSAQVATQELAASEASDSSAAQPAVDAVAVDTEASEALSEASKS